MRIEQKADGSWSVELRYGADRRKKFRIVAPDESTARDRARVMAEVAAGIVQAGLLGDALNMLTTLGASGDDFDDTAQGYRELCVEDAKPKPPQGQGYGKTFEQLAEDWRNGKLAKEHRDHVEAKKSDRGDEARLKRLYQVVGHIPLSIFTLDDAERAMKAIPEELGKSSRRHHAQLLARVLNLAVYPCKLLAASPLKKGWLPQVSSQPQFLCIYPTEDARLLACVEVDFGWRFLFGFAVRTGIRQGNLLDLTWRHVNFEQGLLRTGVTKNGHAVEFDLDPGTLRALTLWREQRKGEPPTATIFPQLEATGWSRRLRASLLAAKVDRHELHEATDSTEPVRFHDLRASFVTFALANGRSEAWIRERTGHTTSQMIVRYERPRLRALAVHDWLPLDVALGLAERAALDAPAQPVAEEHTQAATEQRRQQVEHLPAPALGSIDRDDAGHALPLPLPLPVAQGAADGAHQVPAAALSGQVEELAEAVVAEQEQVGLGHRVSEITVPAYRQGVAPGVAPELLAGGFENEESGMFAAVRPPGVEPGTSGLESRRKAPRESARAHAPKHESARASTSAHDAPRALPGAALLLTESALSELLDLATAAKRWHLVAHIGAQLEALAQAHAAQAEADDRHAQAGEG